MTGGVRRQDATANESGAAMQNASNLKDSGLASRLHKDVGEAGSVFAETEPHRRASEWSSKMVT
jgi:hypothetical protein